MSVDEIDNEGVNLPEGTDDDNLDPQNFEGNEEEYEGEGDQYSEEEDEGLTPVEQTARKQGWRPYDEWDGDPNQWVGAETFVVRGELYNKMKKQSNKINELNDVIKEFQEFQKKTQKRDLEVDVRQLKREKALAYQDEQWDKVVDIDDQIAELQGNAPQENEGESEPNAQQKEQAAEFQEWVSKPENQWYVNDPVLKGAADALAIQYEQSTENPTFAEAVEFVESKLKERFPDEFGGRRKTRSSSVNEPTMNRNPARGKKVTARSLSEDERKVGQKFVRHGLFKNLDEYALSLKNG